MAETELALAAECLGFANFKPSTPVDHSLDELATRHAQSLVHIQTRENALAFVRANASRMTEDTKRRQSLERDLNKTRQTEVWARQWQGRVEAILQQLSKAELEAKLALHDTHEWMQELAEAWHNGMSLGFQADVRLSDIDALLANNAFRLERDRKHTVEALSAQAEAVFDARRIRREIESQEAFQADGVSEAEIDALTHQVQHMQANRQEAEDRLARVAGPLGTLRSAGLSLLKQVDLERRDCPLCGHDWQESETLRHAITAMLLKTDPAIGALEKDVATIGEDLRQHEAKLQRLRIGWDLQRRWEEAGRIILAITGRATQLGLSDDPENWRKEAELGKSWADRTQWRQDFQMTADLVGFFAAADTPLAKQVDSYLGRLGAETAFQTTSLARIRSRNDRATRLLRRLQQVEVSRAKSAVRIAEEMTSIQIFVDEFSRNFETVTLANATSNDLAVVAVNFATEREKLARALLHLEGAKASLAHGRTMARLEECQQKVEQATTRAAQFETRRDTAIQFQKKLAAHRDNFVREQMSALLPAVESLFGRMHANHVFDAICSGDGVDPSLWFGEIDGKPLATANFSQGQRQDLALAIFLARACGLKGSFFLDEPFVHLDDLNRVAMLDILRAIVLSQPDIHLVLTTASRTLARHIHEKFALLDKDFLKIIELQGDPRADHIEVMPM